MKLASMFSAMFVTLATAMPSLAASLPNTGTYFIINNSTGEALQPVGGMVGQNILMYPYEKGGMQKWVVTRIIDPATKKPTNRYNIRLAGENSDLQFHPHDVSDRTAVLLPGKSTLVLDAGETGIVIKSVEKNGDALFVYPDPPMNAEARFGPSDGSAKYQWTFELAN